MNKTILTCQKYRKELTTVLWLSVLSRFITMKRRYGGELFIFMFLCMAYFKDQTGPNQQADENNNYICGEKPDNSFLLIVCLF